MKFAAALTVFTAILAAQTERAPQHAVTAIRHWSLAETTRIAIEVSGEFKYRTDRLHNPERIYFDIVDARMRLDGRRFYADTFNDKIVQKVRAAETSPGITRIVLDLTGPVEVSTSQLTNPNRLMIELRASAASTIPTETPAAVATASPKLTPPPVAKPELSVPPVKSPPPIKAEVPEQTVTAEPSHTQLSESVKPPSPPAVKPEPVAPPAATPANPTAPAAAATAPAPSGVGKPARRAADGQTSLVRALGLKLNRVVIDPGHGGHDEGTHGVRGLLEKDLVLDVALRLGKLIQDRMGAEVIYTRNDDTFIPLQRRTEIANESKADLFLSIHANSSPVPRIAGVESYYLNFTESKEALELAARENATSQKSVFDLHDIIQKITLHDKAEESKDFAGKMQSALYAFSARNFPSEKNRGVKKAPFVVLIGANMPSVLAEVGFLSNTREESLLKRSDYRDKLAEALYRGISRYADSLSHFQMAEMQ
ncbi:MAG TPA: N-acetylmuramoyl-L-alanine amidase [Candidatus Limnocylindrales bacterium]|nr:N-acetylmuramoyl-L-alanine amidase [Candidatus Limnocylindrales bacterium]